MSKPDVEISVVKVSTEPVNLELTEAAICGAVQSLTIAVHNAAALQPVSIPLVSFAVGKLECFVSFVLAHRLPIHDDILAEAVRVVNAGCIALQIDRAKYNGKPTPEQEARGNALIEAANAAAERAETETQDPTIPEDFFTVPDIPIPPEKLN